MSRDRWGIASARALCALFRQPDLALGAEFTPTTFAVPWRALAERFRAWLDEAGSGQADAAQRLVAFLDSVPDAELERVDISSRAWVVQRVMAAVRLRPMAEGLVVLAELREACDAVLLSVPPPSGKGTSRKGHESNRSENATGNGDTDPSQVVPSVARAQRNGEARAVTVVASEVEIEPVRWIWPGRLPLAKFVLLDGDPDEGKTAVMIDVAARITRGDEMPDGSRGDLAGPAVVVVVGDEDGIADTLTPRLVAAGADLSRVTFLTEVEESDGTTRPLDLPGDLPLLEDAIRSAGAVMVIADPLFGSLNGRTEAGRDHSVRRALTPIAKAASRSGATFWATRHLNKSGGGRALYRGGESIAFIAVARVALIAGPDPADEGRKVLAVTKCNIARKAASLVYRLVPHDDTVRVAWEGETGVTADGVIAAADPEQRAGNSAAERFLAEALAGGEWRDSREIKRDATGEGITAKQLRTARERLGVEVEREGRREGHGSRWRLPGPSDHALERWGDLAGGAW